MIQKQKKKKKNKTPHNVNYVADRKKSSVFFTSVVLKRKRKAGRK
jgi:hypothetical protein